MAISFAVTTFSLIGMLCFLCWFAGFNYGWEKARESNKKEIA